MPQRPPIHIGLTNPPPPSGEQVTEYPRRADYTIPEGATAAVYAAKRYGGPTKIVETDVLIGTTIASVLQNNPRRIFWTMVNNSANDLGFGFNRQVTTAVGFKLAGSGGVASMSVDEDGEAVTYDTFAIGGVAGNNIHLIEVVRI